MMETITVKIENAEKQPGVVLVQILEPKELDTIVNIKTYAVPDVHEFMEVNELSSATVHYTVTFEEACSFIPKEQ